MNASALLCDGECWLTSGICMRQACGHTCLSHPGHGCERFSWVLFLSRMMCPWCRHHHCIGLGVPGLQMKKGASWAHVTVIIHSFTMERRGAAASSCCSDDDNQPAWARMSLSFSQGVTVRIFYHSNRKSNKNSTFFPLNQSSCWGKSFHPS